MFIRLLASDVSVIIYKLSSLLLFHIGQLWATDNNQYMPLSFQVRSQELTSSHYVYCLSCSFFSSFEADAALLGPENMNNKILIGRFFIS